MWMRYRHNSAASIGEEWSWRYLGECADVAEAQNRAESERDEIESEYNSLEHYRGIDIEVTDKPPADVIEGMIIELREESERMKKRFAYLRSLL